jgi:ubiquinone/menaquinone biosynthesis C-methylase UbiE
MVGMHAVAPPPKDPLADPAVWNAVAAEYDKIWFERLPALIHQVIELLAPERGDRVLDVASGPGTVAVRLAPRVGHVMAVDFAEGMLGRLRGHIMRGRLPNLEGRLMEAEQLGFEDASFDAAVSLFGVSAFDPRVGALSEMSRVVVPGGRIVLGSWAGVERDSLIGAGLSALAEIVPEAARFVRASEDPELLENQLDVAGFEQVASSSFEYPLSLPSVDQYWQSFEQTSPEQVLLKRELGTEAYEQAAARARAALRATYGEGAFELSCRAVLTYGERPLSAA